MSLEQIITAKIEPVSSIFADSYSGLYIPLYQRNYAWDDKQFSDMFNDITDVLNRPPTIGDDDFDKYSHLFGSAIYYYDRCGKYVCPKSDDFLLASVSNIVDGQQRLTTLALIASMLRNDLSLANDIIKNVDLPDSKVHELKQIINKTMTGLEKYYTLDLPNCKSPKIIRMLDDEWNAVIERKNYNSPVALYFYMCIQRDLSGVELDLNEFEKKSSEHEVFLRRLGILNESYVSFYSQTKLAKKTRLNDIHTLVDNPNIMKKLFQYPLTGIMLKVKNVEYEKLIRKLILGNFIQNCLYTVNVVVKDDYERAFAIFETLNTTGKLLTPFECLKPEIVASAKNDSHNDLNNLSQNPKIILMNEIENLLSEIALVADKEKAEKNIVYIFLLALSGTIPAKNVAVQRSELKDRYNSMQQNIIYDAGRNTERDYQINFLTLFKAVSAVYKMYIKNAVPSNPMPNNSCNELTSENEVKLALGYLNDVGCLLGLAPISRYYYDVIINTDTNPKENFKNEFYKSITSTAAFFALWQSNHSKSISIDGVFRDLFNHINCDFDLSLFDFNNKVLKRRFQVINLLKHYQVCIMANKHVRKKQEWMRMARRLPFFSLKKRTAKFLLLLHYIRLSIIHSSKDNKLPENKKVVFKIEAPYDDENYDELVQIIFPHDIAKSHEYFDQLWNLSLITKNAKEFEQVFTSEEKKVLYDFIVTRTDEQLDELYEYDDEEVRYNNDLDFALELKRLLGKEDMEAAARVALSRCKPILETSWNRLALKWLEWASLVESDLNGTCLCYD